MAEDRKLLGEELTFDERISLAQLVNQPGWMILVRLLGEACKDANDAVIRLNPTVERYPEQLVGLQTTARAMSKFSRAVLDSVKVHQRNAVKEAQLRENPQTVLDGVKNRFQMPVPKSPEGAQ